MMNPSIFLLLIALRNEKWIHETDVLYIDVIYQILKMIKSHLGTDNIKSHVMKFKVHTHPLILRFLKSIRALINQIFR